MIHFDIENLHEKLRILENKTISQEFWEDTTNSSTVLKEINRIKLKTESYKKIETNLNNTLELIELLDIERDESLENELLIDIKKLEKAIEKLEINTLLSGKYDENNAIITLHPGAGGTESQDWAQMLYRMYTRWAQDNGYNIKELDYLDGE